MHTKHPTIVIASVLALALAAGTVLAASARATFPGRNGLIAFAAPVPGSNGPMRNHEIFVMNPDGSGLRYVTVSHNPADCQQPSLSPDGRTIVFLQSTDAGSGTCAMTTTGAHLRYLASGWCFSPCFSPDDRQVVFTHTGQVWRMNADGSHQRRLIALGRDMSDAWIPTYSPDGKTIVFVAEAWARPPSPEGRCEILAMNPDGTHLRRLAYTTEANYVGPPTWGVSFSPDGRTIVYRAHTSKGGFFLRVMNADGTHQRLLPRSYGFSFPCYSPDGRRILCVNGHGQICVVNANGTHWRRLTHVAGGVFFAPNWGPHVR